MMPSANEPGQSLPFVSCLCPTYRRPQLLENAIACFTAQDYPADRRELVILDDAGELLAGESLPSNVRLVSIEYEFQSLSEKYNAIAGLARGDVLAVWEDDDIYLPWHLSASVAAMSNDPAKWSKPSRILTTHQPGAAGYREEPAAGRFHASIAFPRTMFEAINGWPITKQGGFDLQMMSKLQDHSAQIADPAKEMTPSYVFRFESTHAYHGQSYMSGGPANVDWYDRIHVELKRRPCERHVVTPQLDSETRRLYEVVKPNSSPNPETAKCTSSTELYAAL